MIDGFFDVESRGAFEAYQRCAATAPPARRRGARRRAGGHRWGRRRDAAWFDRYVRGVDNGVEQHPRVQLWIADGDREDLLGGDFVRYDAADWPVPGTRWARWRSTRRSSGTAHSINDGSLGLRSPARTTYAVLPGGPS